jgi:receptor-type tyrosine-protein phosphatase zeta
MWSNFSTKEDVPNRVENLKVTHTTASRITVQWNVPSPPNGVIIAYSICYWILGNKCAQAMNVSQAKKTIQDLDPGIPYKISVTAFTSAGQGEENTHDPIIFTVELPPNRTVSGIRVNWTSPTTVNVSWTPLTLFQARGFPIYKVVITSEGRTVKSDNTTDSHLSAEGLDQNTLYSVSVQPLTDGGKAVGKTSNSVNFGSPTTQSSFPVWIVIIVVLLILSILICLVIFIIIVLFR